MKALKFAVTAVMVMSAVFLTSCGGGKKMAAPAATPTELMYGDPVAAPGHSELIVHNTTGTPLNILVNDRMSGSVPAGSAERVIVTNNVTHNVRVQNPANNSASRPFQLVVTQQSSRFILKATASDATTLHLARTSVSNIAPVEGGVAAGQPTPPVVVTSAAQAATVTPATGMMAGRAAVDDGSGRDDQLIADRDRFFNRMDGVLPIEDPAIQDLRGTQAVTNPSPASQAQADNMGTTTVVTTAPAGRAAPAAAASADKKQPLAVYVTGDRTESERRALGAQLLSALTTRGNFIVVERNEEFLATIENEHMHQRSDAVDDNQIRSLGRQFGVQYICIVNIAQAFGSYQVSARIVDIETAQIIATGEGASSLASMDDMRHVTERIVRGLLR